MKIDIMTQEGVKEIIDRIMCGNYENVLDVVDNMRIN